MPESFAERLSQFTPDGTGLDRDGLLFAAGRASVRPNRGWAALACTLAASQVLTCVLFWPKSPEAGFLAQDGPPSQRVFEQFQPSTTHDDTELGALNSRAFVRIDGDLPPSAAVESMAPQSPPLHALDRSFLSN
jgi:hypothetical protein